MSCPSPIPRNFIPSPILLASLSISSLALITIIGQVGGMTLMGNSIARTPHQLLDHSPGSSDNNYTKNLNNSSSNNPGCSGSGCNSVNSSSDEDVTITITTSRDAVLGFVVSLLELTGKSRHHGSSAGEQGSRVGGELLWAEARRARRRDHGEVTGSSEQGGAVRNGYRLTAGIGWHKLYAGRPLGWNDARKSCLADGARLAVIDTEGEAQLLTRLLQESRAQIDPKKSSANLNFALIGIHDLFKEGDWATVSGESIAPNSRHFEWNTKTWGSKQPDNGRGSGQHCGAIYRDGTLDDVRCDRKYPYFCEIPLYVD